MRHLLIIITLSIFLTTPYLDAAPSINRQSPNRTALQREIAAFEKQCIDAVNIIRKQYGLPSLSLLAHLSSCARTHSENMAAEKVPFSHDGFDKRAAQMQKIAQLASFGENVAYNKNYDDPIQTAVEGWMKSPSHRDNILGKYSKTGVGVATTKDGKFYITQLFATPTN